MGAFADSLFAVLMSWVRALVSSLWALISSERTSLLEFLGKNWITIVVVLVAAGLVIDWLIWMIRWKPYALRGRIREARRREEEDEIEARAKALFSEPDEMQAEDDDGDFFDDGDDGEDDWLPERPVLDERDEQAAIERAESVPDGELGAYPGMRYDQQAQAEMDGTRRFGAVHQEGPGAAEVNKRRAEIDAWQQQMQDEARAERMRRMEEMRRAEEARLAEEARAAQAAQAEEERLAQAEYARQLEEYEREKARYEEEMAQYQRDLAAYEAAMARKQTEAAEEIAPKTRTRARRKATYSDMVQGETVEQLPATPAWPKMEESVATAKKAAAGEKKAVGGEKKPAKGGGLIGKMAHLIEPEREEITGVNALPPRVDMHEAYRPAAKPDETKKRRRR